MKGNSADRKAARKSIEVPAARRQPRSQSSSQAATRRSRRPTATRPCRPTSRPCRTGNATSGVGSTRSSCAPCPTCAKPCRWNTPFYGIEGQGWFLAVPLHDEVHQGRVPPRHFSAPSSPDCVEGPEYALLPCWRGRPLRRGACSELDQTGLRAAGRSALLVRAALGIDPTRARNTRQRSRSCRVRADSAPPQPAIDARIHLLL